ncbi:hypothetical protein Tco_0351808 [Tanacetum coccineum]
MMFQNNHFNTMFKDSLAGSCRRQQIPATFHLPEDYDLSGMLDDTCAGFADVSTKSVTGQKGRSGVIIGLGQWMGSCTKPSDEMISCISRLLASVISAITDIKCVLTQKAFDAFCNKFHIPEEVHLVLPNQNDTMHKRLAGKIGLYTSKRSPNSSICYTKPIDSLKNWNDNFFWVDDFACPSSFLWRTAKHVIRDPALVADDFNEQDYATLVAHPFPFQKFPEAFLCLVGLSRHYTLDEETYPRFLHKNGEEMDIFSFIHTPNPTKVKIVEREQNEGEPLLLETTIGRTIPLLPVAPDRAESELDASVERLFDKGDSGNQTEQEYSIGGEKDADIQPVIEAADTVVEDVALVQPKRQRKRKYVVVDAGEASHPPKKLREDHRTPSGTSVGGKSISTVKRLLAGAVLNAKLRVAAIPTFLS